jgi:hypothetical protein
LGVTGVNDLGVNSLDLFDALYDGCAIAHLNYIQLSTYGAL